MAKQELKYQISESEMLIFSVLLIEAKKSSKLIHAINSTESEVINLSDDIKTRFYKETAFKTPVKVVKMPQIKKHQNFQVGSIYEMLFIGDSELKPQFICTARTEKFATFESIKDQSEVFKRKIKIDNENNEYILSGNYSMAPSINSKRAVG